MRSAAPLPFNMVAGLTKVGIDAAELAAEAGLALADLKKPLTEEQADRFFTLAYERVGNPAAGLALGMQPMRAELFGVVGFAAMTSTDFGAALARIGRYNALVSACELDIVAGPAGGDETAVRMRYDGPERPYSRCRMDIQMGTLLGFGRLFTERQIAPARIELAGEPPPYHALYTQVFGCPTLLRQTHDAIVFRSADLRLPLVSANPSVAALFEDAAERGLTAYRLSQHSQDTAEAVRGALRDLLRGDAPSVERVASVLCVSERTLQRRLAREGVRFTTLLDEVRLEMARRYLLAGRASLTDIAYLLGFVDPNSFFRSFKRWTGQTPADYLQGGLQPARSTRSRGYRSTGAISPISQIGPISAVTPIGVVNASDAADATRRASPHAA